MFVLRSDSDLPSTCRHLKGQLRCFVFIYNGVGYVEVPKYYIFMNISFVSVPVVGLFYKDRHIDVQSGKPGRCVLTGNVCYHARAEDI